MPNQQDQCRKAVRLRRQRLRAHDKQLKEARRFMEHRAGLSQCASVSGSGANTPKGSATIAARRRAEQVHALDHIENAAGELVALVVTSPEPFREKRVISTMSKDEQSKGGPDWQFCQ